MDQWVNFTKLTSQDKCKYGKEVWQFSGAKTPRKEPPPTHQCQFMQANEVAKETTKMAQQSDQLPCPTTNFQAYH
jgi:hypothetical protein